MAAQKEQLTFSNYRLTSEQGKCISCYRAVPIFAAENPFLESATYPKTQQYNLLEKICIDCVSHHMERIRSLPHYHKFEIAAKYNNDIENERFDDDIENLEQFNLHDSTGSNSSAGICDCEVKENHEFYNSKLYNYDNEEETPSRFIRITERYKFHDGIQTSSDNNSALIGKPNNNDDTTGLFKNIKKHVNYPNYLYTPNDLNELTHPIPFTLPAELLISKKVKIEEKMKLKPDPDFIFENYEHHKNV